MRNTMLLVLSMLLFGIIGQAAAQQDMIVYPSQGQSRQKMEKDQYECHNWAKQQTGFDPMAANPPPPTDSQSDTARGVVKGGAVGALGGLAIGSLSGNAGAGAAIGATAGGVFGGMRAKNKQDRTNQSNQQYYQQRLEEYNRACRACLIGRGYTVQ